MARESDSPDYKPTPLWLRTLQRVMTLLAATGSLSWAVYNFGGDLLFDADAAFELSMAQAGCGDRLINPEGVQRIKRCGPVIEFEQVKGSVTSGPPNGIFKVEVYRRKLRSDCAVKEWLAVAYADDGTMHDMKTSIGTSVSNVVGEWSLAGYSARFKQPDLLFPGDYAYIGKLSYQCPEGVIFAEYPVYSFEVTDPDDEPLTPKEKEVAGA